MPPLPTLWDPAGAVDKLPQPFRMIDKILADIVEQVVDLIGKREQQRKREEAAKVNLTFSPHAVMEVPPQTTAFLPVGIAGIVAIALPDGELRVYSARDPGSSFSDRTHTSPVTAMEAGLVVTTSGRLLAAASRGTLSVHEVDIKTCEMTLLVSVPLPLDADDTSSPTRIHWSDNLCHLAVCHGSGALSLYCVRLPTPTVNMEGVGAFVTLTLSAFGTTRLEELLRMSASTVKAFCLGSSRVGTSNLVWQMQQRPDKNPHSDRYHKTARGAYIWWEGANRLLLINFEALGGRQSPSQLSSQQHPALDSEASSASAKPITPGLKSTHASGRHAAEAEASGSTSASGDSPSAPPRVPVIAPLARDWILPHNVTAAATTSDHKTMAWGLADGSVVLWDDRSCCATKVLPRLKGSITALAWVNGVAHKLMCASAEGNIFIADILKPEDSSAKPYELPQAVHEIHFLPYEAFALCICRGRTSSEGETAGPAGGAGGGGGAGGAAGAAGGGVSRPLGRQAAMRPRILWYNVLEEKPVAELTGPGTAAGQAFGLACCVPPPPPRAPRPQPAEGTPSSSTKSMATATRKSPAAGGKGSAGGAAPGNLSSTSNARQAVLTTLAAMGANMAQGPKLVPVRTPLPPGRVVNYPATAVRDTYLVVGGDVVDKLVYSNFADEDDVPQRVTQLYMFKVDALVRHLLPDDEAHSRLGRVVLDRLLADLEAPKTNKKKGKRVKMELEDTDAPKLTSSMRKPDPFDEGESSTSKKSGRAAKPDRHITFGRDTEGVFDENGEASGNSSGGGSSSGGGGGGGGGAAEKKKPPKEVKVYPKETKKGLKLAPLDTAAATKDRRGLDGKPRLAPLGLEKAKESPPPFAERSQSPPWHHTNPLARIHPDWEEAPVLVRIMERIGSKGGGRKRRDKRMDALQNELMAKYSKEAGAKPNLFVPP
ncbi:hypothetical protein Agub_g29 [Astrephomene gubernaculifera]|uniref:Uncharacterized protein n=1 Tax=Astrephomene gubernaculifera TaxID=47775 RepID=A0AAD3HGQ4_9CHLO|nr:hypothetical protein Agub_g29 [Astrephomene gubernaculifera]